MNATNGQIRSQIARTREPLNRARHLPGDLYTAPEIYEIEKEQIFRKEWLCVARVEELENPGDFKTLRIADDPIVVCRDRNGVLRAFYNVCRHRGTEVVSGGGNRKSFQCPYHGWTYELSGRLLGAPFTDEVQGFDKAQFGLKPIRLETWGGFVFVNLDPAAISLDEHLGEFARHFGPYRPEECRLALKVPIEYDSNWKTVAENLVDIYHLATLHAESFGDKQPLRSYQFHTFDRGYYGRFKGVSVMTLDGKSRFGFMPWLSGDYLEYGYSAHLQPNMGFYPRQDNIHFITEWPLAVDRSVAIFYLLFPKHCFQMPDFHERVKAYEECFSLVFEEDRGMISALQRGFRSKGYEPGPMSKYEIAVHHVINYYLDRIFPAP
jgi:Rieske 2Fe-2S family protein